MSKRQREYWCICGWTGKRDGKVRFPCPDCGALQRRGKSKKSGPRLMTLLGVVSSEKMTTERSDGTSSLGFVGPFKIWIGDA